MAYDKRDRKLRGLTAEELEAEANKLLFGSKKEPRRIDAQQYQLPKKKSTECPSLR